MSVAHSSALLGCAIMLGLLATGCDNSTEPEQQGLIGDYALLSIDATTLPLVTESGIDRSKMEIVSGRIEFLSVTRLVDVISYQRTSGGGVSDPIASDSAEFTYRSTGDTLIIFRPQFHVPSSYEDTGLVDGANLVLTRRLAARKGFPSLGRHEVVYEKP